MKTAFILFGIIGALIAMFGSFGTMIGGFGATGVGVSADNSQTANAGAAIFWAGMLSFLIGVVTIITSIIGGASKSKNNIITFALATLIMGVVSIYLYNWVSGFLITLGAFFGIVFAKNQEQLKETKSFYKTITFIITAIICSILSVTAVVFKNMDTINESMQQKSESEQTTQSKNTGTSSVIKQETSSNLTIKTTPKTTFDSVSELFESENVSDLSNGFEFIKLIEYSTKIQDKEIATTLYIKSKDWSGELTYKTFEKDKKTGWHTTSTKMLEVLEGRNALNLAPSKTPQIFDSNTQALFTIDSNWMSQGESGEGKQVYLFNKADNNWKDLGYLKIGEDNSGAYESNDPKSYTNTGTIYVNKDRLNNGLPDIIIKRTGTEWKNGKVKPVTDDLIYTFKEGKYTEPKKD